MHIYVGASKRLTANFIDNSVSVLLTLPILLVKPHLFSFASMAIPALYYIGSWYLTNGSSLGKKTVCIKIESGNLKKLSLIQCTKRYLGYYLSLVPLGFGYIMALWDKKHQSLHDKFANTVVIETGAKPNNTLLLFINIIAYSLAIIVICVYAFMFGLLKGSSYSSIQKAYQELSVYLQK